MSRRPDWLGVLLFVLTAAVLVAAMLLLGGCRSSLDCPPCPPPPAPVIVERPVPVPCSPPPVTRPHLVTPLLPPDATTLQRGEAIRADLQELRRYERELAAALAACTAPVPTPTPER